MAKVVSGSVSKDPDCRICDLKREFNQQIKGNNHWTGNLRIVFLGIVIPVHRFSPL